jgi:hypothetical protein
MARKREVSDEGLARLRALAADGWTHEALAEEFDISRQHVGRLVRGEQRSDLPVDMSDGVHGAGVVAEAVEHYLVRVTLNRRDEALAAIARSLAVKLDAATVSESATAAAAAPRLASELAAILGSVEDRAPKEPDGLDRIRARYEARRAGVGPPAWAVDGRSGVPRSPAPAWVHSSSATQRSGKQGDGCA